MLHTECDPENRSERLGERTHGKPESAAYLRRDMRLSMKTERR